MDTKKERTKNTRHFLKIWFLTVSQFFGIVGAVVLGYCLDGGFQGYVIGYIVGLIISFGGSIGLS